MAKCQSILKKIKFTIATAFNLVGKLSQFISKNERVNWEEHQGSYQSLYRATSVGIFPDSEN